MGFLGGLHRNLGDSSKVGAVCVEAPVRFCAGRSAMVVPTASLSII
jgi:hypothetical protein